MQKLLLILTGSVARTRSLRRKRQPLRLTAIGWSLEQRHPATPGVTVEQLSHQQQCPGGGSRLPLTGTDDRVSIWN